MEAFGPQEKRRLSFGSKRKLSEWDAWRWAVDGGEAGWEGGKKATKWGGKAEEGKGTDGRAAARGGGGVRSVEAEGRGRIKSDLKFVASWLK